MYWNCLYIYISKLFCLSCEGCFCVRRKFCQRLCIKLGIKCSKVAAPGKHLPYEDVSMEQVRLFVRTAPARLGVHERLIANFDQAAGLNSFLASHSNVHLQKLGIFHLMCRSSEVWTCHFDHETKALTKDPSQRSKLPATKVANQPTMKAALENLQKALFGNPEQESSAAGQLVPHQSAPAQLNAAGRMCQVENARHSRTTTTLSFIDGHIGRAFVSIRNQDMSAEQVEKLNFEMRSVARLVFQACSRLVDTVVCASC